MVRLVGEVGETPALGCPRIPMSNVALCLMIHDLRFAVGESREVESIFHGKSIPPNPLIFEGSPSSMAPSVFAFVGPPTDHSLGKSATHVE